MKRKKSLDPGRWTDLAAKVMSKTRWDRMFHLVRGHRIDVSAQ